MHSIVLYLSLDQTLFCLITVSTYCSLNCTQCLQSIYSRAVLMELMQFNNRANVCVEGVCHVVLLLRLHKVV